MFEENKKLKDPEGKSVTSYGAGSQNNVSVTLSYTKTNKLIMALYMVTDIIDKDEPLRNKLRTRGTEIISDINTTPSNACGKITEVMSFLDIASAMNIISGMNCNILRKEFLELDQSIRELTGKGDTDGKQINLSEFFNEEVPAGDQYQSQTRQQMSDMRTDIGHKRSTRIGVQKGGTLMKALSDRKFISSLGVSVMSDRNTRSSDSFDLLKKQRREDILNVIKILGGNATIKDIKDKAQGLPAQAGSLVTCGEKTLQRELVSMVKDGVLNKTGEKRWSRYFLKN